ncbi:LysR family transcriptional regulator [Pollutimonas bauzanensis]|uniref:DNA-binding transcriptional regulator, LysR family n=1 Tax=Pollutimonas bauzanensis TaxID=658167 RepID=A0A1M5QRY2_9BURK|nr:LysR family transcriptional regulator [Pollutimonas bauzanensis]SHH16641.1 DNA-binding transcriptional regulator, LysR family [Pollutimonas bauzanensis]
MQVLKTTLEQWRVLQAVVEYGGYAQAAAALHRSQSAVSYMVARLQEQAGVELLAIEGRKARLTGNGKALLVQASELLADAHRLEQLAARLEQGWEAELRLVVDVAFPTPLLLQALTQFTRAAGQTRIQLSEVVLSGADEALLAQRADVLIGTRVPAGYLGDLLLDVDFVAVAHPSHPLHRLGRELDAEDLKREMQIVLRDSGTLQPRDEGWLGSMLRWTVSSMETSAAMVADGLGFAWLPRHLIQKRLEEGSIWPLPLGKGQSRRVPLYLVFGGAAGPGPAARQLGQVLRQAAGAMPGLLDEGGAIAQEQPQA